MPNVSNIKNLDRITDIFGEFPSFHDAEVLRMVLDRGNFREGVPTTLVATIHVWRMTNQIVDGQYVLENHTLVTFRFEDIQDLEINDFNIQNVLGSLAIADVSSDQLEWIRFVVTFEGLNGVTARFNCRSIIIDNAVPYMQK